MFFRMEPDIAEYLENVWETMVAAIKRGLNAEGALPGGLGVQRKAKFLYSQRHIDESPETRENRMVCSYAFAVAEENASGGNDRYGTHLRIERSTARRIVLCA